jgi:hypothetical protein
VRLRAPSMEQTLILISAPLSGMASPRRHWLLPSPTCNCADSISSPQLSSARVIPLSLTCGNCRVHHRGIIDHDNGRHGRRGRCGARDFEPSLNMEMEDLSEVETEVEEEMDVERIDRESNND